jgi:hypothetical protein
LAIENDGRIRRLIIRGLVKGVVCILPIVLLKSIALGISTITLLPIYAFLFPNIGVLILSYYLIPWTMEIIAASILLEATIGIFLVGRKLHGHLLSNRTRFFLYSVVFTSITVFSDASLNTIISLVYGVMCLSIFVLNVAIDYLMPSRLQLDSANRYELKSIQDAYYPSEFRITYWIAFSALLIISIWSVPNLISLDFSIHMAFGNNITLIILGGLAGLVISASTFHFAARNSSLSRLFSEGKDLAKTAIVAAPIVTISLLVMPEYASLGSCIFLILILLNMTAFSDHFASLFVLRLASVIQESRSSKKERTYEEYLSDAIVKLLLRSIILPIAGCLVILCAAIGQVFAGMIFLVQFQTLSYSVIENWVRFGSLSISSWWLPLTAAWIIAIEGSIGAFYLKEIGEPTIAFRKLQEVEFPVALANSIFLLSFLSPFQFGLIGIQTGIFLLVVTTLSQLIVMHILKYDTRNYKRVRRLWAGKWDISSILLMVLILVTGQLLYRYTVHLLLVGFIPALEIITACILFDSLIVKLSLELATTLFDHIQQNYNLNLNPYLINITRDALASLMAIEFMSTTVFAPKLEFTSTAIVMVVVASAITGRHHSIASYRFHNLTVFQGFSNRMNLIKKNGKALGLAVLLLVAIWPSAIIASVIIDPPTSIRVAVIDSGINTQDPQLFTHVVSSRSFVTREYGYDIDDFSTNDAVEGRIHGTILAKLVLEVCPRASIVDAKVMKYYNNLFFEGKGARSEAIIAAIHWAVEDENVNVINLSFGGPRDEEELQAIEWAWSRGVVIVTAAGNEQLDVAWGASITSPADSQYAISVAALDSGNRLFNYSSWGPLREAIMKPDIAALGNFLGSNYDSGTSFASPRIAGAAAELIRYCKNNDLEWTPGLIKAALMKGADSLNYAEYKVGSGKLNLDASLSLIQSAPIVDGVPWVAYVSPRQLPMDLDRVFAGTIYKFQAQITCSVMTNYTLLTDETNVELVPFQSSEMVNQTALLPIALRIPDTNMSEDLTFSLILMARNQNESIPCHFKAEIPRARVALDFSHSINQKDSIYADYLSFYHLMAERYISITEIRSKTDFLDITKSDYDVLMVMEPYLNNTTRMTQVEIDVIHEFYNTGGGVLFVIAQSGSYQNISHVNEIIDWSGISYANSSILFEEPVNASSNTIIEGLYDLKLNGRLMNVAGNATIIASIGDLTSGNAIAASFEAVGRLVVLGSQSVFTPAGFVSGTDSHTFAIRIIYWLLGYV